MINLWREYLSSGENRAKITNLYKTFQISKIYTVFLPGCAETVGLPSEPAFCDQIKNSFQHNVVNHFNDNLPSRCKFDHQFRSIRTLNTFCCQFINFQLRTNVFVKSNNRNVIHITYKKAFVDVCAAKCMKCHRQSRRYSLKPAIL